MLPRRLAYRGQGERARLRLNALILRRRKMTDPAPHKNNQRLQKRYFYTNTTTTSGGILVARFALNDSAFTENFDGGVGLTLRNLNTTGTNIMSLIGSPALFREGINFHLD